jgi:hypothetical protein
MSSACFALCGSVRETDLQIPSLNLSQVIPLPAEIGKVDELQVPADGNLFAGVLAAVSLPAIVPDPLPATAPAAAEATPVDPTGDVRSARAAIASQAAISTRLPAFVPPASSVALEVETPPPPSRQPVPLPAEEFTPPQVADTRSSTSAVGDLVAPSATWPPPAEAAPNPVLSPDSPEKLPVESQQSPAKPPVVQTEDAPLVTMPVFTSTPETVVKPIGEVSHMSSPAVTLPPSVMPPSETNLSAPAGHDLAPPTPPASSLPEPDPLLRAAVVPSVALSSMMRKDNLPQTAPISPIVPETPPADSLNSAWSDDLPPLALHQPRQAARQIADIVHTMFEAPADTAPVIAEAAETAPRSSTKTESPRLDSPVPLVSAQPGALPSADPPLADPVATTTRVSPQVPDDPAPVRELLVAVNPPHLGPVTIRVQERQDRVYASLVVDHIQARQLLLQTEDQVRTLLQSQGLEVGGFEVTCRDSGGQHQQSAPSPWPQNSDPLPDAPPASLPASRSPAPRAAMSQTLVDIYV